MSEFLKLLKLSMWNNFEKGIVATKGQKKFIKHFALTLDVAGNINFTYKRNTIDVVYLSFSKVIDHISHGSLIAIYLQMKG